MPEVSGRVGVVGLGMMGAGIAGSLLDAGLDVVVTDAEPSTRDRDARFATRWRDSVTELASEVEMVVVVVVDAAQTSAVLAGPDGVIASGARPIVMSCATLDVDDIRSIARVGAAAGIGVLDVGIAGGPDAAATGDLVTTVGGDANDVERCAPVLDAMSRQSIHVGPVGSGMELKLIKNAISFMTMNAVHEGLLLAEELGYSPELVARICRETNLVDHFFWFPMSRPSARPSSHPMSAARASAQHFASIAQKDLAAAAALGDSVGLDHATIDLAHRRAPDYFLLGDQ